MADNRVFIGKYEVVRKYCYDCPEQIGISFEGRYNGQYLQFYYKGRTFMWNHHIANGYIPIKECCKIKDYCEQIVKRGL